MLRLASYHPVTFVDGEGARCSIYFSGCDFRCKGCYNKKVQSPLYGEEFTKEKQELLLTLGGKSYIDGISLLGGDPFAKDNVEEVYQFARKYKELYPEKTIWAWTGYLFEQILKKEDENYQKLLSMVDILVDGPFIIKRHNPELVFRGSSNQRIIQVKESLKLSKIVLYQDGAYLEKEAGLFDK